MWCCLYKLFWEMHILLRIRNTSKRLLKTVNVLFKIFISQETSIKCLLYVLSFHFSWINQNSSTQMGRLGRNILPNTITVPWKASTSTSESPLQDRMWCFYSSEYDNSWYLSPRLASLHWKLGSKENESSSRCCSFKSKQGQGAHKLHCCPLFVSLWVGWMTNGCV